MTNLVSLYKQLKSLDGTTDNKVRFSACPIPGYTRHRLAKDINGFPCLLISTQESSMSVRPASVKLEHLEVLYDVNCRISHKDSLENSRFTVISCTKQDVSMQEYFLRTCSTIVAAIGDSPTYKQVSKAVDNLVELFRALNEAPRKSVQGLWAELLLISLASNPTTLIKAWHRSPGDKYDFGFESQRIESKSATSRLRKHHFSLEQLSPLPGVEVLVTSVFVERIGSGMSLAELTDMVRSKVNNEPELLFYLDQMIGATLGNNWKSAAKDRFDYQLAKKSLAFFSPEVIPTIDTKLPKEVSNVYFEVDLTNIPTIDKKILKSKNGILGAVFPK